MDCKAIVNEAIVAANKAGDEWMANAKPRYAVYQNGCNVGTMLDNCGNAHLQFKDARTATFKAFKRAGFIRGTGNKVVEIQHRYKPRQEHGLQIACVEAAEQVFKQHGITDVRVWDYID